MKKALWIFVLAFAVLQACENKNEKDSNETPPAVEKKELTTDNLQSRIKTVNDSLNTVWKEMITSDDQKFSDIKRLLQEVSYTSGYNVVKYRKLVALTDSVYSKRYLQDNMTSADIDQFDAQTADLIAKVFAFIEETPEMESHTITETLFTDIQKADNDVVNYRVRYDRWAKEFNQLLYDYKDSLQQFGEPYSSFKSKPIFELPS